MTEPTKPSPAPFDGNAPLPPRRRLWLPYAGVAVLLALIIGGLWPSALQVELAPVAKGPLLVTIDEEGQTRVRNRYVVSSPVGGQLRRIDLKAGAIVEAGKTIVAVMETGAADLLDARSLSQAFSRVRGAENARERAAAQLERSRATLEQVRLETKRSRSLFEQKIITQQELDLATTNERVAMQDERAAGFSLRVADYELEQARTLVSRSQPPATTATPSVPDTAPQDTGTNENAPIKSAGASGPASVSSSATATAADTDDATVKIYSPVSGRILRVLQESARPVLAGTPLLEVGDSTDLEARIEVLSRDGVGVLPGARVFLDSWGGEKPLNGVVRLVEPSAFTKISALGVEEQRVYVIVDFVDSPQARPTLGDGFRVEARIVRWSADSVLRVPSGALFQRNGQWQAFLIEGGRARLRNLGVGHTNGVETEITDGVSEGAQLIVYPGDRVRDGSRIKALDVETKR